MFLLIILDQLTIRSDLLRFEHILRFSKIEGSIILNTEKHFHFKANRNDIGSSKKRQYGIFKIALRVRDRHVFM